MKNAFCFIIFSFLFTITAYTQIPRPEFSEKSGFYKDSVIVSIHVSSTVDAIYYTFDGSDPDENSIRYTAPLTINQSTVLKAAAILGGVYSKTITSTYFINEHSVLPVFSISTDSNYFFHPDTGFYVVGPNPRSPNYGKDWEVPVHIEFFETDGKRVLDIDAGAKIYGESSRMWPQKSLAIFARSIYGDKNIKYKFFPELDIDKFENILLRNGGSDWNQSMFRDGYVHTLVKDLNVDKSAYRPSVVYINGKYWGIHNIREKTDEHYVESHYGVIADSVDINLYWGIQMDHGTYDAYWALWRFIQNSDFTKSSVYDSIKTMIDLDAWLNYILTEIITDNYDWPDNNVKCWRERAPGAKWRWVLWDTDCAFDLRLRNSYNRYSIDSSLTRRSGGSTLFFTQFLQNKSFQEEFINRFADLSNTIFSKGNMLRVLSDFQNGIEPEIDRHFERWNDSTARWYRHIDVIKTFINERHPYIRQNFIKYFNLSGTYNLSLNINIQGGGTVNLNSLNLNTFPWTGEYFTGVPVHLTVKPNPGYIFKGWVGAGDSPDSVLTFLSDRDTTLTAVFEKDADYKNIVINEINYNSAPEYDTEDWVEFYNAELYDVDISLWTFTDSDSTHKFIFPEGTIIKTKNYLVLCRNKVQFTKKESNAGTLSGDFDFGLNNAGEFICLHDVNGNLIDSLTYDDDSPWNKLADGTGKTLELRNPLLDNSRADNWGVSAAYGTPGKRNSSFDDLGNPDTPDDFVLYQNFPNPFNAGTTIRYGLTEDSRLSIKVYNILGEVSALIQNAPNTKGYHEVRFSAGNLASGVYFYSVEAAGLSSGKSHFIIKKMIVLK